MMTFNLRDRNFGQPTTLVGGATIAITPVILCGGAGSRLWPLSRDEKPKQFHPLFNERSLLANTVSRTPEGVFGDVCFKPNIILGSDHLVDAFSNEILTFDTPTRRIYLEPAVRDTAAAIAAITAALAAEDPNMLLLVLPSDARIDDHVEFRSTIAKAARAAQASDAIMTIGVTPTRPETQYGYIEKGAALGEGFSVSQFREKPGREKAQEYLDSGKFLWNAGMFLYRAGRMADEFARLQPEIWACAKASIDQAESDGLIVRLSKEHFGSAPKQSIDYAIMEKATNIGVVPAHFDWDDLGSWSQLYAAAPKDSSGNAVCDDAITVEARDNYARSDGPLIALAGVDGLTVVAEDNKVLVLPTAQAHLTKRVTAQFKALHCEAQSRAKGDKAAIKRWLFDEALPLWASAGIDFENGGSHEALEFDGMRAAHAVKRLRVTARQIYSFAHASMMGWRSEDEKSGPDYVLRHCFMTLVETGWHRDGGFVHLYNADGSVNDDKRDLYDQCFVLLAMAALHQAKGWPEARHWADKTLKFMDKVLLDPVSGGYFENDGLVGPRRANPHMHFLEAMLAWYDATREEAFLDRAEQIVVMFERIFFDARTATVTEYFDDDWNRSEHYSAVVEPGHHYEWAWLLMRFEALRSREGLSDKARTVYATANAFGHHGVTKAAADTMNPDGSDVSVQARLWPQTEALKAAMIFEQAGVSSAADLRKQMISLLFERYLVGSLKGGWNDAIDSAGNAVAKDMPASTLYHVITALRQYLD